MYFICNYMYQHNCLRNCHLIHQENSHDNGNNVCQLFQPSLHQLNSPSYQPSKLDFLGQKKKIGRGVWVCVHNTHTPVPIFQVQNMYNMLHMTRFGLILRFLVCITIVLIVCCT